MGNRFADEAPKNRFADETPEKPDISWSEVPGKAVESVVKGITEDVPKAVSAVIESPGETAAAVGKGVARQVGALANMPFQPAHQTIRSLLNYASPDWAKKYGELYIEPTQEMYDQYQKMYGGWLGGEGKWGWTPQEGERRLKQTISEHPLAFVGDVATVAGPALKGVAAVATPAVEAATRAGLKITGKALTDVSQVSPAIRRAGINVDILTDAQKQRLLDYGNTHGWGKDTIMPEYRKILFEEADTAPTKSMLTDNRGHYTKEDRLRQGQEGPNAEQVMLEADVARGESLNTHTQKLRETLTGSPEALTAKEIGERIAERTNALNDAARADTKAKYTRAFDLEELRNAGVPDFVPSNDVSRLHASIQQAMRNAEYVPSSSSAPLTKEALDALKEFSRTGRIPEAFLGEVMPPPGASGVSWQSAELMRKYLNGLRRNAVNAANSSRDFTDAAGMRYVLDEFDQILGKSNPLLNEARAAHAERLKTFDPDRKTGPEGLRAVMQTAGRTGEGGNTGINLYNKLFSGTKMSKGQVEAQLDHLKKIFADDPTGMQAIKEGALQRIFYNDNNVLRTPKQTATAIRDALEGNGKDTYRGLFVPEELNALRRHQERLNVVGDKQTARNPSKTSYNQNSTASRKYLMSAGAGAGAWLGHSTGIPYMGEIGAMMGAGAAPLVEAGMNMRSAGKARQMSFPTQQMYSPILAITPPAATASQIAPRNVSISPENRRRGGHLRSVRSR